MIMFPGLSTSKMSHPRCVHINNRCTNTTISKKMFNKG